MLKKSGDIYSLSNFYSELTNFNVEKEDSFRFHGFKDEFKLMSMTLSTSIVNMDNDILVTCVSLNKCKNANVNGV